MAGQNSSRDWVVWSGHLPPAKGLPGDKLVPETNPFTLGNYILRCVDLLKVLMLSVIGTPEGDTPGKPRPEERSTLDEAKELDFTDDAVQSPVLVIERLAKLVRNGTLTAAAAALQSALVALWGDAGVSPPPSPRDFVLSHAPGGAPCIVQAPPGPRGALVSIAHTRTWAYGLAELAV